MKIFNLPDLGEGLPDAEIHEWHVSVGDTVEEDQTIVSMETAKAVVDVPAPQAGTIAKLYGEPGDIIETGNPLIEFEEGEVATQAETSEPAGGATVAGNIQVSEEVIQESATGVDTTQNQAGAGIKALPAVRALAAKLGVDLNTVTPSGKHGEITLEDITAADGSHSTVTTSKIKLEGNVEPLRGVRRTMARAMSESHAQVVDVTIVDDADLSAWSDKEDITCRVIRALCTACAKEPALNAHYSGAENARVLHPNVNLGIAMDSPDGLFVPVIEKADTLSPADLRAVINEYKTQVRERSIPQEKLHGATISLSNFGTFAGRYANPVVVPPMVAILGTGKIRNKILPLSLTFDHRAVTGGEASRFLGDIIEDLQS